MVSVVAKLGENSPNMGEKPVLQAEISTNCVPNCIWIVDLWHGIAFLSTIMIILHTIMVLGPSAESGEYFARNRPDLLCASRNEYNIVVYRLPRTVMFFVNEKTRRFQNHD